MGRTTIHSREYRELVDLLRELREKAGITQVEMAERLERGQSWISKVERAERRLDPVELRQFCDIIGTDLVRFVRLWERRIGD